MAEKINTYEGPYHWFLPWFYHRKYMRPLALTKHHLRGKHVLDIGCGDGRLSREMAKYAKSVHGMDNQKIAIELAEIMCRGVKGLAFSTSLPGKQYDVITSFDVIEHVKPKEVDGFLAAHRKHLKEDGILILTTPNRRELRGRIWGHKNAEKHYQEFSKDELTAVLEKNGFRVEECYGSYLPPPLPGVEHFASVIPLRYLFDALIRAGKNLPSLSQTFVIVARKA